MKERRFYSPGETFHKWTLISWNKEIGQWLARCECGTEKFVWVEHLTKGKSKGCMQCSKRATHGMTHSREYRSWSSMRSRCLNRNDDRYHQYGGRGIKICSEWNSFEKFLSDMGPRPDATSLDRIDINGDYTKENCRWATAKEQQRNRRIDKDRGFNISELAEKHGIKYGTLATRLQRGWDIERALSL